MFFYREGNKSKYANKIIPLFPPHDFYIEGFVGIGGIFFNKPLAKYNMLNDNSKFIYSIYEILKDENKYNKMIQDIEFTPNYFDYINNYLEEPLKSILLTLYSLYGDKSTQSGRMQNQKQIIIKTLKSQKDIFLKYTKNAIITNKDIFKFINSISWREAKPSKLFIYLDPPYCISKGSLKDNIGWSIEKLEELILLLLSKEVRFAISEYNDSLVLELFKKYNLNIHIIDKAKNLNNRKDIKHEILATNYLNATTTQISLF